LVLAGAAVTGAAGWWTWAGRGDVVGAVMGLALLFMIGDLLPRAVAGLSPHVAMLAVRAARATLPVFRPLLALVHMVERGLSLLVPPALRRFGGGHERDLLARLIALGETEVADVMTPRIDVVAVNAEAEWQEVEDILRRGDHAQLPVYAEDLDEIVGIIHAKHFTAAIAGTSPPPERWRDLVHPAPFVPESKSLAAQLRDFQRGPAHLAIVVDEYGGTAGLITLEDILEEVVGEIYGEYESEEAPPVEREGSDRFWVDGAVTLDALSEALGTAVERDDVSTVGGLVYSELGRVPRPGEELAIAGFRVVVERVVRRRVERVYFERRPVGTGASAARGDGA
jgi:Mg2+/Co2+ transporter CorB